MPDFTIWEEYGFSKQQSFHK